MRSPSLRSADSQTALAAPHLAPVAIVADDLTGACDAAAAFLPAGHTVRVWFGAKALHATAESVQAFNTNSRTLSPEQAERAVSAASGLKAKPGALFFKKIDSAARGPLAAELLAAQRTLGAPAILVAPSFPAVGRTVRGGILEVQDAAGQHAFIPLAALFPPEVQPLIAIIAHPDEIAEARAAGKSILLCDAIKQIDLEALARAAAHISGLLYAGSAGLAQAIASQAVASIDAAPQPPQPLPRSARTLIVAGTPHPVTAQQLDRLASLDSAVQVLRIRCEAGNGERIRTLFRQFDPSALILTGGETAQLAVDALDAHSLILRGELAPGIPWGTIQGGPAHGRVMITKSGGFGSATTLIDILAALSGPA